jgi:uncharacterized protein YlaN (UPF0358 family)
MHQQTLAPKEPQIKVMKPYRVSSALTFDERVVLEEVCDQFGGLSEAVRHAIRSTFIDQKETAQPSQG